jgi:hypothetical protein
VAGLRRLIFMAVALVVGCRPTLDDRPWLITRLQIVGWTTDPPEAPPGSTVAMRAIALDPAGPADTTAASWTLCRAPKRLDENRAVSTTCLSSVSPDAVGDPVQISIPTDACRLFGPDTPQPAPGAPPTRPNDVDVTGGYYQPLTISLGSSLAVGLERITCDLPDASFAVARAFQAAYHPNQNPTITALGFTVGGTPVDSAAVPAGARVSIEAAWLAGSAETFAVFDRASKTVVETQETIVVSWYVTGGDLDRAATEIDDPATISSTTTWTAPPNPAALELVVVLRDSRGGSDSIRATLVVQGG